MIYVSNFDEQRVTVCMKYFKNVFAGKVKEIRWHRRKRGEGDGEGRGGSKNIGVHLKVSSSPRTRTRRG